MKHRPEFTGGIEAKLLKSWHIELFKEVKPKQIFFAYDSPDDLSPLENATHLFSKVGYGNRNILRCYVLIGYPGDNFDFATKDLKPSRLSASAQWPCFTEISKAILLAIGASFNALGAYLPLYILRIGISFYLNDKLTKSYKLHLSSFYEVITH